MLITPGPDLEDTMEDCAITLAHEEAPSSVYPKDEQLETYSSSSDHQHGKSWQSRFCWIFSIAVVLCMAFMGVVIGALHQKGTFYP
jgi:hypothetical protein